MSDDSDKNQPITYAEFQGLCKDAGIEDAPAQMEVDFRIGCAMALVTEELVTATEKFPAFNSAHEGYGVLMEEVRELEEHVFKRQGGRDIEAMKREAIQVAAMAIRFAADICHDEKGQN